MVDPISLTALASSLVGFVFTTASTTVIEKPTEATLEKIKKLTQIIRDKLKSNLAVITELNKENDQDKDLETIRFYLEGEMRRNKDFTQEIQELYDEINQDLEKEGQGSNILNVYGGKAYMQNQNKGNIYNADTMNFHGKE